MCHAGTGPLAARKGGLRHEYNDEEISERGQNFMQTIAIIDDDWHINEVLADLLTREGYEVLRAYSGTEAVFLLSQNKPDLVLLDLMMPGLSGEEVLSQIKEIPVIVISAKKEVSDKVELLLGGAADYITKPFDVRELLARITVQLREAALAEKSLLTFRELSLDDDSHQVCVGDKRVKLTKTEYGILRLLMMNPGQVLTKSQILDRIVEDTPDCVENSLKVHISNLRKKLREAYGREYIETVWGIGFKMKEN